MKRSKFPPFRPVPEVKIFPERSSDWPDKYPALIKPWIGGVRAYWLNSIQAFQLQDGRRLRVDGIQPYIPEDHLGVPPADLLGEFYEKGASHAETLARVLKNEPTDNLDFTIFDAEMALPATERASYCLLLPAQSDRHTRIAEMYQADTRQTFKSFLDVWRERLFNGALTVGYVDPWLATEYEVQTLFQ
jgi:hypothetical protein